MSKFDGEGFPPVVITTMSYSGLALARSLGRRGIQVYGVAESASAVGMSSRYITPVVCPNIIRSHEDTVDAWIDLAGRIGRRAVLFPTGDALVLPLSKYRQKLSEYFSFVLPDEKTVERLVTKDGLTGVIQELGIPGPNAMTVLNRQDLDRIESEIRYPVLIKPVYSASWYRQEVSDQIGYRKVVLVENREELFDWYERIAVVDPEVILQEYVPGEDARLYYICGYFDAAGELRAAFMGQKVRITPVHFGSASFVLSMRDDKLVAAAKALLKPLCYKGLFGVEFKLDPRDNIYKVIEVNVRWGLWDGLSERCGVELAYLAYADAVGIPYQVPMDYRTGVRWLSIRRDLNAFQEYRKEGLMTTGEWIRTLMGETQHATFAWDDPLPCVREVSAIIQDKAKSLFSLLKTKKTV